MGSKLEKYYMFNIKTIAKISYFTSLMSQMLLTACSQMNYVRLAHDINAVEHTPLIADISDCYYIKTFEQKISTFTKPKPSAFLWTIRHFQILTYDEGGNAIANVRLNNLEMPVGTAEAYRCPQETVNKALPLQENEDYMRSLVILPQSSSEQTIETKK